MLRGFRASHYHGRPTATILLVVGVVLTACAVQPAPESTPGPVSSSRVPVGTMSELMVDILYPAGDAVFYIQTRTPTDSEGWASLQMQTLMLAEVANLLMTPERVRDEDQWVADAQLLLDAGERAYRAAKDRDVEGLVALNDALYQSCVTCHRDYRPGYGR